MVKFLGLYDAWGSFLDFAPSVHEAPRVCNPPTVERAEPAGKARAGVNPYPFMG